MCCWEPEEKEKESARGTMGRWKREEREERLPPFRSSHRPPRAFNFFDYCYFIGIPGGSLCGGESFESSPLVAQWSCMFWNFPGFIEEGDNINALFLAWGLFLESPGNSSGQKSNICCGSILSLVFLLFRTHYHALPYPKTKENKI